LSIQGTEFELLARLEDALEAEDRMMRTRLEEAKERSRAVKALAFTAKAADKRAVVRSVLKCVLWCVTTPAATEGPCVRP
jgi:hypothetical protein